MTKGSTLGSTSGGGGGSDSTPSGSNLITSTLKNSKTYTDYKDKVNTGELANSYFQIDAANYNNDSDAINVDLTKNVATLQDVFKNAKTIYGINSDKTLTTEGEAKLEADVTKVNNRLDTTFANAKVNGNPLKDYLVKSNSQYFDSEGHLKIDAIRTQITNHLNDTDGGYANFKSNLTAQITNYFAKNSEGMALANKQAQLVYVNVPVLGNSTISAISKVGGNNIYTGGTVPVAVNSIVTNLLFPNNTETNNTDYTGTYKVTLGTGDYVNIKINPAPTTTSAN